MKPTQTGRKPWKYKKRRKPVRETREQAWARREQEQQEIRRGFMADSLRYARPDQPQEERGGWLLIKQ